MDVDIILIASNSVIPVTLFHRSNSSLLLLDEVKKIIIDLQGGRRLASLDVMAEMSRIKRRASPEPVFSPSTRLRKLSIDSSGSRAKQYSFDMQAQSSLDAMISAEILTRVNFLCDLR